MQLGLLKTLHSWARRLRNQRERVQDKKNSGLWSQKYTYPQWGGGIHIDPQCISTCKVLFLLSTKYINMYTQEGLQQGKKQELY